MKHTVTISARRLKRLESAENVARAFRTYLGTPNCEADKRQVAIDAAVDWSLYWLDFGSKDRFKMPEPVPARWKYNRDQAMHGWPDKRKGITA